MLSADQIISKLETVIGSAPNDWSEVHWVENAQGEINEGDLCSDCANKMLEDHIKAHPEEADDSRIGASQSYDSDGPCSCSVCNTQLNYQLTDWGSKDGIENYVSLCKSGDLEFTKALTAEDAFDLELLVQYVRNFPMHGTEKAAESMADHAIFLAVVESALDPSIPLPTFREKQKMKL